MYIYIYIYIYAGRYVKKDNLETHSWIMYSSECRKLQISFEVVKMDNLRPSYEVYKMNKVHRNHKFMFNRLCVVVVCTETQFNEILSHLYSQKLI